MGVLVNSMSISFIRKFVFPFRFMQRLQPYIVVNMGKNCKNVCAQKTLAIGVDIIVSLCVMFCLC